MKLYVKETKYKNADGDWLTTVKTYKSEPLYFSYLIWM